MKYLFLIFILLSNLFVFAQELIPYRKGDKWGFANREKQIVIEPQFDEVGEFRQYRITWAKVGDKYGYIDMKGAFFIKAEFDKVNYFYPNFFSKKPNAQVTKGDSTYLIDFNGNRVNPITTSRCGSTVKSISHFRTFRINGKIGLWRDDWKRVINDSVYFEIDTSTAIWDDFRENRKGFAAVSKDGKWAVIDTTERLIVNYQYDEIKTLPSRFDNFYFITKQDNQYGFIDFQGKTIADPIYKKVDYFQYGVAKVWTTDDFWFYIDREGKEYFE